MRFENDILSFDNHLRDQTDVATAPRDFSGIVAYNQRDESYVLFGYHLHVEHSPRTMGIAVLASSHAEQVVDFPSGASSVNVGRSQVIDSTSGYDNHTFAVLRKVPAVDGVVIDFVDIK